MKNALLLTLPFLLFAFFTNLPLAFSEQVLDFRGRPVIAGRDYFIIPPLSDPSGGGLKLAQTENSDCPLTVLQDASDLLVGKPVKLTIPGISSGDISTGSPVEIEFIKKPECASSSKWSIIWAVGFGKPFVGIGGPQDHPGRLLVKGTFKIQKYRSGYKLSFCVDFSATCKNIGRFDTYADKDGYRLSITENEPFEFVFVPASQPHAVIKSVTGMKYQG